MSDTPEMVERVAEAIFLGEYKVAPAEAQSFGKDDYRRMARAAIEVMREPTMKMIEVALAHHIECEQNRTPWNGDSMYRVMIDQALR